jgi:cytochrome b561
MWLNNKLSYGRISKLLHWFSAIIIFSLFFLGYWMTDLDYTSQWNKKAPHLHKSIGILLCLTTLFRIFWRIFNISLTKLRTHSKIIHKSSTFVYLTIYLLLFILFASGYLISMSDERAILVFNWFEIPALGELFEQQTSIISLHHEYTAYSLITLSILHILGALKHHFIDKDNTLKQMITP